MATASEPFRLPIAKLRGRTGSTRQEKTSGTIAGVATSAAHVRADRAVEVAITLEAVPNGIMAIGTVEAVWVADCRRCLDEMQGPVATEFRDLFEEAPTEGDSYLLGTDEIDIEPMLRDALFLELPLAPLCSPTCPGPGGEYFSGVQGSLAPEHADGDTKTGDPRWAALDGLEFATGDDEPGRP